MSIAVIDYGAGNLSSVLKIIRLFGEEAELACTPEAVLAADRVVLPGVGAAGEALARLREQNLEAALHEAVRVRARPLLCICLGMQLLAERHHEFGEHRGFGWIKGEVIHLKDVPGLASARIPHMGWNRVRPTGAGAPALGGDVMGQEFYFAHSYTVRAEDASIVSGTCDYGAPLVVALQFGTVLATQFHPEKSQVVGEKLIAAFLDWRP